MNGKTLRLASLSLLALFLFASSSSACIGLVAGKVHFNVMVGTNETLQIHIYNACQNQSISYQAGVSISPVVNQTTPKALIIPNNGIMGPGGYASLNVTVHMPSNVTPGTVWSGGALTSEVSSLTSSGGATVEVGVVKQFTVVAVAAPINYGLYAAAALSVIIGIAGGTAYYLWAPKKGRKSRRR